MRRYTFVVAILFFVIFCSPAQAQWVQTNGPNGGTVSSFAVSGTNLFAGTYGAGVFLSTNNGTSWTAVNTGLPDTWVAALAVSPLDSSGSGNLFAGIGESGVFLSTNSGISWTRVSTGLTGPWITSLLLSPASVGSGTNLFAGIWHAGVCLSTNNGTSWTAVNTGLTNADVWSLVVSGTYLFAGTYVGGVWRRPLSEMITDVEREKQLPTQFVLEQNYPNPFNPSTKIGFSLPAGQAGIQVSGFTTLKVYDVLGREVKTLVNEELKAGSYETTFDASGLASGVYFYKLQAGEFVSTKKLLLTK